MYLQRHTVSRQELSLKHLNIEMLRYGHSVSFRSKDFDFENIGCLNSKHCHFLWSYFPHYSPRYTSAHLSSSACCSTQDWQYAPHHERSYGCLCPFRIIRSAGCKLQDTHFCTIAATVFHFALPVFVVVLPRWYERSSGRHHTLWAAPVSAVLRRQVRMVGSLGSLD